MGFLLWSAMVLNDETALKLCGNTQRISFSSSFSVSPQVFNTALYLNSLTVTPPQSMLMVLILYSKSQVCQDCVVAWILLNAPIVFGPKMTRNCV